MKKTICKVLISVLAALLLVGCNSDASSKKEEPVKDISQKTEEKNKKENNQKQEDTEKSGPDFSTQKGILGFLEGDWTLYDTDNDKDLGVLSVSKDSTFVYKRLDNNAKGSGKLSFDCLSAQEGDAPDGFSLLFDDVKDLLPGGYEIYGDEGTGGIFHIGSFEDEDYLYLKEIGNGDSVVSMYVFNPDEEYDPDEWNNEWLFYRSAKRNADDEHIKNDTFYAWIWERDSLGVWLQPMKEHEFETYGDYTNYRFNGGYFSETANTMISYYALPDDADLSGVLHTDRLFGDYPLAMYEVTVDKNSTITSLSEVPVSMYNIYDMGELEPDFTYEGTKFIINGFEIDMREFVAATDAIVDCMRVGQWIIIECHINPDKSVYEFYNIPNGDIGYFEYEITGSNLTWRDDDLSTAVYVCDNAIYDIWGHMIAFVDSNEEIGRIRITDPTTITADIRVYSDAGKLREEQREYEYDPCDRAVMSYFEARLGEDRQMLDFFKDVPVNAAALIIVNPPEMILDKMSYPVTYEENALDKVVVVSLMDDQEIFIESLEPDASGKSNRSEVFEMNKGECKVFDVTVPEGMPLNEVVVRTPDWGDVYWDIWQLSGRSPQMSTYIIAGD